MNKRYRMIEENDNSDHKPTTDELLKARHRMVKAVENFWVEKQNHKKLYEDAGRDEELSIIKK